MACECCKQKHHTPDSGNSETPTDSSRICGDCLAFYSEIERELPELSKEHVWMMTWLLRQSGAATAHKRKKLVAWIRMVGSHNEDAIRLTNQAADGQITLTQLLRAI